MADTTTTQTKPRPIYRNIHISQIVAYRLPPAGMVSIGHRISGVLMFLLLPFVVWLFDVSLTSETSYERFSSAFVAGLGILRGKCVRFDLPAEFKVPHMGWNQCRILRRAPLLGETPDNTHFYFVHSYHVVPDDPAVVSLQADYGGPFCAAVWKENLFATQFHPEKSQADGLRLLKNFAET